MFMCLYLHGTGAFTLKKMFQHKSLKQRSRCRCWVFTRGTKHPAGMRLHQWCDGKVKDSAVTSVKEDVSLFPVTKFCCLHVVL